MPPPTTCGKHSLNRSGQRYDARLSAKSPLFLECRAFPYTNRVIRGIRDNCSRFVRAGHQHRLATGTQRNRNIGRVQIQRVDGIGQPVFIEIPKKNRMVSTCRCEHASLWMKGHAHDSAEVSLEFTDRNDIRHSPEPYRAITPARGEKSLRWDENARAQPLSL